MAKRKRPGLSKLPAPDVLDAELERIAESNEGKLTAEGVVKAAASRRNPLHPCFIWDDSKAAHLYRLTQARHIIRVVVTTRDGEEVPKWVNVSVGAALSPGYYRDQAKLKVDEWKIALASLMQMLASAERAVADLERCRPQEKRVKAIAARVRAARKKAEDLQASP